ncbi:acetyltransferase domain-containing protein [Xylariaceae sp. FL0255]|nr:acetyltransferase domain-containing protein [Xylariaceae sp. FL0255]
MSSSPGIPAPPHPPPADLSSSKKIIVKTTWPTQPLPPTAERKHIRTKRLLIRPYQLADAECLYEIRRQPEVMQWTSVGVVDRDVDASREWIKRSLPPNDKKMFNFLIEYMGENGQGVILDENDQMAGEVVGHGGCHRFGAESGGWPEIGYLFKKEAWGKGLATEFMRGWAEAWWALPREVVEVEVDRESVEWLLQKGGGGDMSLDGGEVKTVPECVFAVVEKGNPGSSRVLEKLGFQQYTEWDEPDERPGFEGKEAHLLGYLLQKPGS